jgi:hypothetical protein
MSNNWLLEEIVIIAFWLIAILALIALLAGWI